MDRPSPGEVRKRYDRLAGLMPVIEPIEGLFLGRARRRHFGGLEGRVLDVACGSGPNFPYLHPSAELVGVDLSPAMLDRARANLAGLERDGTVVRMDAANLAFSTDTFDAVISSMSMCTFPDPVEVLREMARVCRPTGRIALLEHGKSSWGLVARLQGLYAGVHARHFGCQLTQEPLDHPVQAGLAVEQYRRDPTGIITAMDVQPVAGRPSGE